MFDSLKMESIKIIVRPKSANLWWGIYGFCEKTGWEDLNLFYENEERIGGVCLNGKAYVRAELENLKTYPEDAEYVAAAEKYLVDNQCHYWYYYDEVGDEDFHEVPFDAPRNTKGVKPRFLEIWHPDEAIGIPTLQTAITAFAKKHLRIENCEIEIQNSMSIEESLKSFKENKNLFGGGSPLEIKFSEDLLDELSVLWRTPKAEVLKKLENVVKQS